MALLPATGVAAEASRNTPNPIALGAWIPGTPGDPSQIDRFAALVGASPAVMTWYQDWAHADSRDFNPVAMNAVVARNIMPMVTWEPWDYTAGVAQPAYSLQKIIAGTYDTYIHRWAHAAASWGKPFYLRFAHEMNGAWYPWAVGVNGNTGAQYITAWRHVSGIFRQEGATKVRWVWSANISDTANAWQHGKQPNPLSAFYPGDSYVDWVGMEGYNWGTSQSWSSWTSLASAFGGLYAALTPLTSRPMMIAETASTEVGGDKASWIMRGLLNDVPSRFPRIRAVIWFNENKETDWRVNSSATALAAFKSVAKSATYQGKLA